MPDAQPPETVRNECLLFNPLPPIVECFVTAAGAKTAMKSIVIAPNLGRLSPSLPLPHWSRHCLSRTQPQDITGECPHPPVLMWGQVVFPAFFWVCLLESGSVSSPPGLCKGSTFLSVPTQDAAPWGQSNLSTLLESDPQLLASGFQAHPVGVTFADIFHQSDLPSRVRKIRN